LNGEDENVHKILAERTVANYSPLLNGIKLLIIDEAQNVPQIGLILKLIIDEFPFLTIIYKYIIYNIFIGENKIYF
jgi:predicted AAA+ superfamily ATPase